MTARRAVKKVKKRASTLQSLAGDSPSTAAPRVARPLPYDTNVFINCPFDEAYAPLFDAIVFAVHDRGFIARCSLGTDDSASDTGGQDVKSHRKGVASVIRVVRDWLRNASAARERIILGGPRMYERYQEFLGALPAICSELNVDSNDLMYNDYTTLVVGWLREHSWWRLTIGERRPT